MKKGFTLIEVLITVAVIGILAAAVAYGLSLTAQARLTACVADIRAHAEMTMQLEEQTRWTAPTTEEMYEWMGSKRKKHYYYVPNNYDANSGHGNDLDICDEENPGASTENRDCLDIKWVWICNHHHGSLGRYVFADSNLNVWVVPLSPGQLPAEVMIKDFFYWMGKDPNLQKWIRE